MPDELRLDYRTSGPVFSKREELVVWAKDDGTLHTTDQDGTDNEVGTGGGGGGPTILGPFTVNWDSEGVDGDGLTLAEIDAGTLILGAWVEVVTGWGIPATVEIVIVGVSDPTNWNKIFFFNVNNAGVDASGAFNFAPYADGETQYNGARYSTDGLLLAQVNATGASQGQAKVYAWVYTP